MIFLMTHMSSVPSFLLSKVICIPFLRRPFQSLESPDRYGFENAVNLKIPVDDEDEFMGAWFMRPEDGKKTAQDRLDDRTSLTDEGEVAILYLHGNSDTRSQPHRVGLYSLLLNMGIPVLAFDYRGFGDSSQNHTITESCLMMDAATAFEWFRLRVHPSSNLIVWGHSLGSGVGCKLGHHLSAKAVRPDAFILEAPFLSMIDEIQTFKLASLLEYAGVNIEGLLQGSELVFDSGSNIKSIREPVLVLHAKDDFIVPYESGQRLFEVACKEDVNVKMVSYESDLRLGHNGIYTADSFREHLESFIDEVCNSPKDSGCYPDEGCRSCKMLPSSASNLSSSVSSEFPSTASELSVPSAKSSDHYC